MCIKKNIYVYISAKEANSAWVQLCWTFNVSTVACDTVKGIAQALYDSKTGASFLKLDNVLGKAAYTFW